MTDWDRVESLKRKGRTWSEIAKDQKVGYVPPGGADAGRALKTLYFRRRSEAGASDRGPSPEDSGATRTGKGLGRNRRTYALVGGAAIVAVVVLLLAWAVSLPPPSQQSALVTYCGGEGSAAHYHPLLVINVDGTQKPLPYDAGQFADIGYLDSPGFTNPTLYCASGGIHALHTHDGSGIIHVELPPNLVGTAPTLGDFFEIWGEPVSSHAVWSYSGSVHATVQNLETGAENDYSSNPAGIPLAPDPCGLTCNPVPIPQSLIFNGAYGGGSSGGVFSGEVIYLNVTSTA